MKYALLIASAIALAACGANSQQNFETYRPIVWAAVIQLSPQVQAYIKEYTGADEARQCEILNLVRTFYPDDLRTFVKALGTEEIVCPNLTVTVVK